MKLNVHMGNNMMFKYIFFLKSLYLHGFYLKKIFFKTYHLRELNEEFIV